MSVPSFPSDGDQFRQRQSFRRVCVGASLLKNFQNRVLRQSQFFLTRPKQSYHLVGDERSDLDKPGSRLPGLIFFNNVAELDVRTVET